jgi:uncharacterized repeat protein (TIGR01451 family)
MKPCVRRLLGGAMAMMAVVGASSFRADAVAPITSIQAYFDSIQDDSNDFASPGAGSPAFPTSTIYQTRFTEGQFDNLIITAFDVGTNNYIFRQLAEKINIVRVDNPTVTGAHHILLYDRNGPIIGGTNISLSSQYAATMEEILLATIINRGVDNVFCNTGNGDGNNNNIERIDYIFDDGYPAYGNLRKKGFMVMDRGGNDALWIAAILELDTNGLPARFSQPVFLATTNWGDSGITLNTIVYRGYDGNYRPSANLGPQPLTGQYIEWEEFGITTNTLVFGYSLAAADVPATQNWLQVWTFPLNTTEGSTAGGLDLMSGGALVLDERDNAMIGDRVWNDLNQNGIQDPGEPGVSNVLVRVWDSSGTNLAGQARTDDNGLYYVYALEPNLYQLEVVLPTNWLFSPANVGPDDFIDSDINPTNARSAFFSLAPRTTNLQWDAGMFLPPTDLGVTKTVTDPNPRVGTNIVFTLSVTNFGPYTAENVTLTDLLPVGLTYTGHAATVGTYTPSNGLWTVGTLAVGAGERLVITARVNLASGGLVMTNTVSVTSMNRPDTNSANDSASVVVAVRALDIAVAKIVSDEMPDINEVISYTVFVTNRGPDNAASLTVIDLLPAGLTFSNASADVGSYTVTSGVWNIGSMLSGAVARLTITARVNDTSAGLVITNTATALTLGLGDTNAVNDSASVIITVLGADVGVTKTPSTYGPFAGDFLTYRIVVTNGGPNDTEGVSLFEPLATGLVYESHIASSGVYDNVSGIWTVGFMAAGASATLDITVQASTNAINSLLTNRARIVSSTVADGNTLNNTGVAVIAVSSLRIFKSSSALGDALPGSVMTYTIVITNAGSLIHTNVTVTDPLPPGTVFVPGSTWVTAPIPATNFVRDEFNAVAYTNNNGNTNWVNSWTEIGETTDPNAGSVRILTNAVRIANVSRGLERTVNLAGATDATLSFLYRRAALDTASDFVAVFASSNNGITFTEIGRIAGPLNDATFQTTNISVSAFAVSNTIIRFLSSSTLGSADYVHLDDIQVLWTYPGTNTVAGGAPPNLFSGVRLAPGQIMVLSFDVLIDNPIAFTQIVNTAYAVSDYQILPIQASVTNTIAATDIGVTKTVNDANPDAGSDVIFTVVVTNLGPLTATNVTVADPMLPGFTFVTSAATRGSYNPTTAVWSVGILTNLHSASLTLTARVSTNPVYAGATLTNIATYTGSTLADLNPNNNSATVTLTVGAADLRVTKAVDNPFPLLGSNIVFTIAVSNAGPSPASGVAVTELWPAGLQFLGATPSQGSYATGTAVWSVGALDVGASATLQLNASVTTSVVGLYITNRAFVSASSRPDPNPLNNTGIVVVLTSATDPLFVTKISSAGGSATNVGQAPPGYTNLYTIVVTNPNAFAHTGIRVFDPVPTGMTYVASSTEITAPEYAAFQWFDNFQSRFYNNNFGNTNFLTNWEETENNGPLAGNVQIIYDTLRGATYSLRFQGSSSVQWFRRAADLSAFTNAILSFEYRRESLEAGDVALAQISSNGFAGPWTTLLRFEGPADDAAYQYAEFDIRPWISSNTAFRLATTNSAMGSGDIVWLDDVRIVARKDTYTTRMGGLPPWFATNLYLRPGDSAIITYRAIVDSSASVTQVVNTVSVTSDQQAAWIGAAVTDRVEIADVGVGKSVSDPLPDEGQTIFFTINLTNFGPFVATDVELVDVLPSDLTYLSNTVSAGSFNPSLNRWFIPSTPTGVTRTLNLYARVNTGAGGRTLTNRAFILQQRQADFNTTNNSATAVLTVIPPFVITHCRFNPSTHAVEIFHTTVNDQQLYDLLYADAISFSAAVTNWALADRRAGGRLYDAGALSSPHPTNLAEGMLRFYRISAPGLWTEEPRRAGTQIKAFGLSYIRPGQNWVRPWGMPCDNSLRSVLQDVLPGGDAASESTRVMWFNRAIHTNVVATQEVWMANGETNQWICSYPYEQEGAVADAWPLPLADGFCVELPTNLPAQRLPMIFGVPTTNLIQVVPGMTNHSLVSVNIPVTLHPAQMGLREAGFQGAVVPTQADMLWKYDRVNQLVPNGKIWFRTSDNTWRFDNGPTFTLVPTNYFRPDDAVVIRRVATTPMTWTNSPTYPAPTRDMKP